MTGHSQRILDDLKARQRAGERMACPRCGMDVMKTPVHTNALSRAADIYICDACGSTEAMLAYMQQPSSLSVWDGRPPSRRAARTDACRPASRRWSRRRRKYRCPPRGSGRWYAQAFS